jgi:hypothetical protein
LHENPQFVSVKGTTKKADAFGLFVYPNFPSKPNQNPVPISRIRQLRPVSDAATTRWPLLPTFSAPNQLKSSRRWRVALCVLSRAKILVYTDD